MTRPSALKRKHRLRRAALIAAWLVIAAVAAALAYTVLVLGGR